MQPNSPKYLYDIQRAAGRLGRFVQGLTFEQFSQNEMVRSAVERQFEIIGEAISQLFKNDPDSASRITEYRQIIGVRNIIIHAYSQVNERTLWEILNTRLAILQREVQALLDEADKS